MPDYSALKQQILSDIQQSPIINTNQKLLMQKISNGSATYEDAAAFSKVLGDSASKSINLNIAEGIADSELEQFASECLAPVYRSCQDTMLNAGKSIQYLYNKQADINLNPVNVKRDESRIEHIVNRFREAASFDDVAFLTGSNVSRSVARGAVTDTVKENARFQEKVGIDVYISRSDGSGCCDWCSSVCGTFRSFDALPDGFWGIHRGCSCVIDYRVGKTKNRLSFSTGKDGKIIKNTEKIDDNTSSNDTIEKTISSLPTDKIVERQNIHRVGTELYNERKSKLEKNGQYGPSYVSISDDEILELVDKFKGTGIMKLTKDGVWDRTETIVSNNKPVGYVVNNLNGVEKETPVFKIHYGDKGIHIVPDYPSKKRK